jgi:hypothetical protein
MPLGPRSPLWTRRAALYSRPWLQAVKNRRTRRHDLTRRPVPCGLEARMSARSRRVVRATSNGFTAK